MPVFTWNSSDLNELGQVGSQHFSHLWSIGQKGFLSDFINIGYWRNHRLKCPEVAILASFLWGNLKEYIPPRSRSSVHSIYWWEIAVRMTCEILNGFWALFPCETALFLPLLDLLTATYDGAKVCVSFSRHFWVQEGDDIKGPPVTSRESLQAQGSGKAALLGLFCWFQPLRGVVGT